MFPVDTRRALAPPVIIRLTFPVCTRVGMLRGALLVPRTVGRGLELRTEAEDLFAPEPVRWNDDPELPRLG
jgi:hypothetical protein